MNRRTWTLLIVALAVIGGVYAITLWQRSRETRRLLEELHAADHAVAAQAMSTLRERVPSVREQLIEYTQQAGPVRWRSIELLAEADDAESRGALMSALQSEDPTVRASAAQALAKRGVRGAADRIAMLATADEEPLEVRLAAVRAIGQLVTGTHLAEMSRLATDRPPPPPEEEAEAAEAVEEEPTEGEEAEAAGEAAEEPEEPEEPWSDDTVELRVAAVRAVAVLGAHAQAGESDTAEPPAVQAAGVLAEACSVKEHNDEVRQAACYALIDLAQLDMGEEVRKRAVEALLGASADEIGDVRIAAIHGLKLIPATMAQRDAVRRAMNEALNDAHYWVRVAAGEKPIGG